jgi:hypothetical protein
MNLADRLYDPFSPTRLTDSAQLQATVSLGFLA